MEKGMKEPYVEGLAIHDGPESCVGVCEGAGEALTGVRVGVAIEPRNDRTPGCRRPCIGGRQHRRRCYREPLVGPARSENRRMRGISMRENRESPRSPAVVMVRAGRSGKAEAASLR
jgi:hypothetical protein